LKKLLPSNNLAAYLLPLVCMAKAEAIEVEGLVVEILWWGKYKVQLMDMDMEVEAYAAGKMKKFRIKIIPGDLVTVELNPYEPTKGRIVYRTINKESKKSKSGSDIVSQDEATWMTSDDAVPPGPASQ